MAGVIFYFTGTGNSLAVANDLAAKAGDTKVMPIAGTTEENIKELPYDRIGIVFPVYYASIPSIVKQFIKKLRFDAAQYVYGVATYGGSCGMALAHLGRCVAGSGGTLNAGFSIKMPGNYIVEYGAMPMVIQNRLLKNEKAKVEQVAAAIRDKRTLAIPKGSVIWRLFESMTSNRMAKFGEMAANFHATEKCSGCGTCERICPAQNIRLSHPDNRPGWGSACEQCMACIQWCPSKAIEYGNKTQQRKRYIHPEIELADMIAGYNPKPD